MKAKFFSIALSLLICIVLCACDGQSATTAVTKGNDVVVDGEGYIENGSVWSPELFENPSTNFDNHLALVAAEMSDKAEDMTGLGIKKLFSEYGISNCETYNYEYRGTGAFAIGYDTLPIEGDDTMILIIVARGTKRAEEIVGDAAKGQPQDFLDQTVCGNVYDFEEQIWDGIEEYLEKHPEPMNAERLKILITGHSLGGAAANMTAARFTRFAEWGGWWSDLADKDDIYAYTFSAITVLDTEDNVSDGYENIHNVYNFYDTFGPNGSMNFSNLSDAFGIQRISLPNAKFGHTELYSWDEEQGSKEGEASFAANHTNYKKALEKFREDPTFIDLACRRTDSELSQKDTGVGDPVEDEWGAEFIKGTWKNVGTTTFGQAQSGSIIVFDDTHCNYYSPEDTYEVYREEDGQWSLYCISFIFNETLRFSLDIIDDDTVDIYYGSEAVRLERISRDAEVLQQPEQPQQQIDNFVIEGSWLSVGSGGFGQAQPGMTVTFDGTHCNFFSPHDTYAFYQDDGQWKLDCTSFLFSETLTFKVEVIDVDSINVYYGSNCTELSRMN